MIGMDYPLEEPDVLGARLAQTTGPIVVGPWLSELGFEILYWIPFLRWLTATYALDRDRLWVVSRGGVEGWYRDLAAHYLDIFDWYSPRAFRAQNERRVADREQGFPRTSTKQYHISQFDLSILAKVAWHLRRPPSHIIHPGVLYRWFRRHWRPAVSNRIEAYTQVQRWGAPPKDPSWPTSYVAMKFYTSPSSPPTPTYQRSIQALVDLVCESSDVLLLHDPTPYDDHRAPDPPVHPRLQMVPLVPRTNLATQTAVIAHAELFIGTYGGFSYLAPMLGVPTVTMWGRDHFNRGHLDRLQARCADTLHVPFDVVSLSAATDWIRERWSDAA